jgi:hypothetical protein
MKAETVRLIASDAIKMPTTVEGDCCCRISTTIEISKSTDIAIRLCLEYLQLARTKRMPSQMHPR